MCVLSMCVRRVVAVRSRVGLKRREGWTWHSHVTSFVVHHVAVVQPLHCPYLAGDVKQTMNIVKRANMGVRKEAVL